MSFESQDVTLVNGEICYNINTNVPNGYTNQFNGIEHFDDIGGGLSFSMYRIHDPGLGRWLQVDPNGDLSFLATPVSVQE